MVVIPGTYNAVFMKPIFAQFSIPIVVSTDQVLSIN